MKPLNKTIAVLLTGIAIGVLYLLMGISLRLTWPAVPVMVALAFFANRVGFRDLFSIPPGLGDGSRLNAWSWRFFVLYSALFLIRSLVEYRMMPEYGSQPYLGIDIVAKNLAFSLTLVVAFLYSRTLDTRGAMWALVLGIGFNAAMNFVLDRLNFRTDNVFGESRFEFLDARWLPPAVRSNAFFSMACASSVALFLNLLPGGFLGLAKRPLLLSALIASVIVVVVAAVKCQFRNNLFALAVGLPLMFVRLRPGLRLAGWGGLIGMVLFPSLFIGDFGHKVLEVLAPERVLRLIGSDNSGATNMSNRTDLYEYGWERLRTFEVFLFGEGPVLRDAQDAVGGMRMEGYRMPYHGAFLDFLMQSGVIIGVSVVASFGLLLQLGFNRLGQIDADDAESRRWVEIGIIHLSVWFALSVSDSGMSNFETLWIALIPLYGSLACSGRMLRRTPIAVRQVRTVPTGNAGLAGVRS